MTLSILKQSEGSLLLPLRPTSVPSVHGMVAAVNAIVASAHKLPWLLVVSGRNSPKFEFRTCRPNPAAICRSPLGRTQMQHSRRASSHGRVGCRGRLESRRRCLGLREVVRPGDTPAAHCAASTPGKSGVAPRRRHRFTEAEELMYMGWLGCCGWMWPSGFGFEKVLAFAPGPDETTRSAVPSVMRFACA